VAQELDLSRLAELEELLGSDLPQIVDTLIDELDSALAGVAAALAGADLPAAALAAHAARNSGLMIDARPLLDALGALESGARAQDPGAAHAAARRLQETWPRLRRELQRAVADKQ
jgi:hypothetical protein